MPTGIEWADEVWNPVTGCTKVGPGCQNCWAERLANGRLRRWYPDGFGKIQLHLDRREQPYHWRKPRRIFVCSMSDIFHPQVCWDFLIDMFETMHQCREHTFMILTKRPGRMAYFANVIWPAWTGWDRLRAWPSNVWAGVSIDSARYLPWLDVPARVSAPVRFASLEPLLGPLDLVPWLSPAHSDWWKESDERILSDGPRSTLDWVIVGGESGPKARPMQVEWVEDIVGQCTAARVPCFVKQDSGPRAGLQGRIPDALWAVKQFPKPTTAA